MLNRGLTAHKSFEILVILKPGPHLLAHNKNKRQIEEMQ